MRARCLNPNDTAYGHYGARGITICERWERFENFFADMGDCPPKGELERIDNDGDYEPDNCRWATRAEQLRNTRRTILIEYEGKTWCRTDLAAHLGIHDSTLRERIRRGWPPERWADTPIPGGWNSRRADKLACPLTQGSSLSPPRNSRR